VLQTLRDKEPFYRRGGNSEGTGDCPWAGALELGNGWVECERALRGHGFATLGQSIPRAGLSGDLHRAQCALATRGDRARRIGEISHHRRGGTGRHDDAIGGREALDAVEAKRPQTEARLRGLRLGTRVLLTWIPEYC
jgi:hypothetical protein